MKHPVEAIRRVIEAAIKANPSDVGPPIDIVRLSQQGVEWLERKPLCQDD